MIPLDLTSPFTPIAHRQQFISGLVQSNPKSDLGTLNSFFWPVAIRPSLPKFRRQRFQLPIVSRTFCLRISRIASRLPSYSASIARLIRVSSQHRLQGLECILVRVPLSQRLSLPQSKPRPTHFDRRFVGRVSRPKWIAAACGFLPGSLRRYASIHF